MATIYYSLMGEGRGHAARARAMVEQLRGRHRLVLLTSHDALDFLQGIYATARDIEVRPIEGLRFHYSDGKLDLSKTIAEGLRLWSRVASATAPLVETMRQERPELVVSDFEPIVARAAHRCGIPVLSLDHQHFLLAYDLRGLPAKLQWFAWSMGFAVRAFGIGQQKTVVSAFYRPPLRPGYQQVVQVGALLRPAIRDCVPAIGAHIVSYLRKQTPPRVIDLLETLDTPIRVYGLGEQPTRGQVSFHKISEDAFTADLATARAVIAAAGNQLLGESLFLGKPFFALPEERHHEQCINAHYLRELGCGEWQYLEHVTLAALESFIAELGAYRVSLGARHHQFDGTIAAVAEIEAMLQRTLPLPNPDPCVA